MVEFYTKKIVVNDKSTILKSSYRVQKLIGIGKFELQKFGS